MTRIRMLNRALCTLGIVGTLTFGAVQALASPGPQQSDRACPEELCTSVCGPFWYCEGPGGTCVCM